MASYINGLTDYIPQLQTFKPDLNLYANVLQAKQSKYDDAKKKLGSLYGSLLYAPLTREDNIQRRDDFFKMIEQDIKKISGMDLSLPQNVDAASSIFKPVIDDPNIKHDMIFTKKVNNEIERGLSFKNCPNPDDCGGAYWEPGISYLQLKQEDYKNASAEDALKMGAPSYAPYIDVTKKALDYAKDLGLSVKSVSSDGKWLVTTKDGKNLLMPLQYIYGAIFGKDPAIQRMYDATSYLTRKSYIRKNLSKFNGNEDLAEDDYFNTVFNSTAKELKKDIHYVKTTAKNADTNLKSVENSIKREGATAGENDPLYQMYLSNLTDNEAAKGAESYYDEVENNFTKLSNNSKDRTIMRSQVDYLVGNGLLSDELTKAAYAYSMGNREVSMVADPYYLKYVQQQLDMEKADHQSGLNIVERLMFKGIDEGKFDQFLGANGTANQQAGTIVAPGPGSSTAAGEYNLAYEESKDVTNNIYAASHQRPQLQEAYVENVVKGAQRIMQDTSTSPDERLAAQNVLKYIFGDNYDTENKMFKGKDGQSSVSWKAVANDESSIFKLYSKASAYMPHVNTKAMKHLTATNLNNINQKLGHIQTLENKAIESWSNNVKRVWDYGKTQGADVENVAAWDLMFKQTPDGRTLPLNREDYIDRYLSSAKSWSGNPSQSKKREVAGKAFDKNKALYTTLYNSGKIKSMEHPQSVLGLEEGNDGGLYSNRVRFNFRSDMPGTVANLTNFIDDANQSGAHKATVLGPDTGGESIDDITKRNDPQLQSLAETLVHAIKNNIYDKSNFNKRPTGTITFSNIAGNSGDLEALTITDINPEFLKQYKDSNKADAKIFGKYTVGELAQGITVYVDKNKTNSMLHNRYSRNPEDVLFTSKAPVVISTPYGGTMSMQKRDDGSVVATGELKAYEWNYDRNAYELHVSKYPGTVLPAGASAGEFYKGISLIVNTINDRNADLLYYNIPQEGRLYNPEEILNQGGIQQPDMMETFNMLKKMFAGNGRK